MVLLHIHRSSIARVGSNHCYKKFKKTNLVENNSSPFDENELVLFKQYLCSLNLDPSFKLDLKNCIHQLSIEKKLDQTEICYILTKLNHQIIHNKDISKIIRDLQKASSDNKKETSGSTLSNLMTTLFRIDYLEKFNKLDKQKIKLFNQRITHL
jgi:uncharacterized protein YprB with RNaseH-like and TPR domain